MSETKPKPMSLAPGEGRTLLVLGERVTIKSDRESTGGDCVLFENESPPGGGPPFHLHTREDESFYVLQGTYEFRIGNTRVQTGPGCFLFGPRGIPHSFRNVGEGPGRLLIIATPCGLEVFLEELSHLPANQPPDPAEVAAIFQRHGLELVPEDAGQAGGEVLAA